MSILPTAFYLFLTIIEYMISILNARLRSKNTHYFIILPANHATINPSSCSSDLMIRYLSLLAICLSMHTFALPIYYSIGTHGEPRYSQLPPQGSFQVLHFHHKTPITHDPIKQQQCQTLRDNLAALSANGAIYEIDAKGSRHEMTAKQIHDRKTQTEQALQAHCQ